MFDALDLYVPSLIATAPLAWVTRETAWGPADDATLSSRDIALARRLPSTEMPPTAFAADVPASWEGLALAHEARAAAEHEVYWQRYLPLLRGLLDCHVTWVLVAEADCDQHPIAHVELSTAEVVARLDEQRRSPKSTFSLCAVPRKD
jgi:hypothetical protein